MENLKKKVVLFLGAGFSAQSGLPASSELNEKLLEAPTDSEAESVEEFITATLRTFWKKVFGWKAGGRMPSLEDHFTQIDMAEESKLGPDYDSAKLRAIRRMTMHRIFSRLKKPEATFADDCVYRLLKVLTEKFEVAIITTNWDDSLEWILKMEMPSIECRYAGQPEREGSVALLKLHGSVDQAYCDHCKELTRLDYATRRPVVKLKLLLDAGDFSLFGGDPKLADLLPNTRKSEILSACGVCHKKLGMRVVTPSYRKRIEEYREDWDAAKTNLQLANKWLFVGYSMPEADIEVRHLLKSAELDHTDPARLSIDIVLKEDCEAGKRYKGFFGLPYGNVFQGGIEEWAVKRLDDYCN